MSIKRVIITGAGFSSPAKLPIQNKILDLMKEKPVSSFMDDSNPNSFKFMNAYIVVGLYLLDKYSKNSFDELSLLYKEIQKKSCENDFIVSILNDFISNKIEVGIDALDYLNKRCFDSTHKYKELNKLVDLIRNALNVEKIDVNLEDVFTSFDKSLQEKEYMDKYSYLKMDSIRLSLTRLFVYYFYQEVHKHNYDTEDYLNFIKYINNNNNCNNSIVATYNLAGKYDIVAGVIYLPEDEKSTSFSGYFQAYGDGKLIYTSPKITKNVLPKDISFSVTGIQKLELKFYGQGEGGFYGFGPAFGLSNLVASKNFPN